MILIWRIFIGSPNLNHAVLTRTHEMNYRISGFIGKSNIWRFVKKSVGVILIWQKMGDILIYFVCAS